MAFLDNISTPAPVADVGFKISKPNYSATNASPQNLLFSSSWPSLAVAFSLALPNTNAYVNGSAGCPVPHGLNYPPLAFTWNNASNFTGSAASPTSYARTVCHVDNTYIYVSPSTTPIFIVAYAIDLRKDIDYTTYPGSNMTAPYDPNYGIKLVKPGKNINSKNMRDFILHSRCQSPLIQAVKTEATANPANTGVVQYTNHDPYPKWFYGFARAVTPNGTPFSDNDFFQYAPYWNQAYPKMTTDGFTSTINTSNGLASKGATIVVLRDPMFAPTATTIQY